jgi:glycosyltransferase involved in cell wall biosynthesis
MLKVLHIVPSIPYGGAQRVVEGLTAEQRRSGVDARVLGLYSHPIFVKNLDKARVPHAVTGKYRNPESWLALHRQVRAFQPHLLHFHLDLFWSTFCLGLRKSCPWVYHAHLYPSSGKGWKNNLRRRMLSSWCQAVIGVSQSVTEDARLALSPGPKYFHTIYNGIIIEDRSKINKQIWPEFMGDIPPGRPLIGMATRLDASKGVIEFIEAIPAILKKLPQARFVLAGEGPSLSWLKAQRQNLNLANILALPGFIERIESFWAALDFALFTSPREALPLCIIESQTKRAVVVGYQNGSGSDEIILNHETGILVPWGDKGQLTEAFAFLWNYPKQRHVLADSAYERVKQIYSLPKMTKECLKVYQMVLH